jgi:hypothetical protein
MSLSKSQVRAKKSRSRRRGHERLWTENKVAPFINVSKATLRRWRKRGKGPPFMKLGPEPGAPGRYSPADVEAWLMAARRLGEQAA